MIPHDFITAWRQHAPWIEDFQVEQDLIICRALVAMFADPALRKALAFRGGTALYKLFITPPARYSEDIDLVQITGEPIGPTMTALRAALDPWLGTPQWKQNEGRVTLVYRIASEDTPPLTLRLKVEINSREHFSVFGMTALPFTVSSRWFEGTASIVTYDINELLGTKLRALYQRRKSRDLFDLSLALTRPDVQPHRIIEAFAVYMERQGERITRAMFERNLAAKLHNPQFNADIGPLLAPGHEWNLASAMRKVSTALIEHLPGDPWKGETR